MKKSKNKRVFYFVALIKILGSKMFKYLIVCCFIFFSFSGLSLSKDLQKDSPDFAIPSKEYIAKSLSDLEAETIGDSLLHKGIRLRDARKLTLALDYFAEVLKIGKEEKNHRLQFLAINNIGLCYYVSAEYAKALDHYLEAYEIAKDELPTNYELTILNNIALVYKRDRKLDQALAFFLKAYESAVKLGLNKKAAEYGINLGTLYNRMEEFDKAKTKLENATNFINPDAENYHFARISLAETYELKNELHQAEKILSEIAKTGSGVSESVKVFAHNRLARVQIASGKYDEARTNALKAAEIAKNLDLIHSEYDAYNYLSKIGEKKNNYQMAYEYLQKNKTVLNTLQQLRNQEKFSELQAKFELSKYEYELQAAEERYDSLQKFYTIIVTGLILIGVLVTYAARIRWLNMRQKNNLLQKKEEIAALELEKSQAQHMALEQEIKRKEEQATMSEQLLREEIELKNKEISSRALVSATKNDILHQVITRIEKANGSAPNGLNSLKNELKNTIDIDKDWKDFVVHFEQTHEGFFQQLMKKHKSLNNNDLRFIAYLKINLGSKEIARLLNITPASFRKRKMRLRDKLGLERHENLETYIYNL